MKKAFQAVKALQDVKDPRDIQVKTIWDNNLHQLENEYSVIECKEKGRFISSLT